MRSVLLIILLLSTFTYSKSVKAVALNGKTVTLKSDGTWSYYKETFKRDYDFRNTHWGASKDSVAASETAEKVEIPDTNALCYRTEVDDLPAILLYIFFKNHLVFAKYIFPLEHSNRVENVVDYEHLAAIVAIKHGPPAEKDETWKSSLVTSSLEDKAAAVTFGHLDLYAIWNTKDVTIQLTLSGDNGKATLVLSYLSNEYENALIFDQLNTINFTF